VKPNAHIFPSFSRHLNVEERLLLPRLPSAEKRGKSGSGEGTPLCSRFVCIGTSSRIDMIYSVLTTTNYAEQGILRLRQYYFHV